MNRSSARRFRCRACRSMQNPNRPKVCSPLFRPRICRRPSVLAHERAPQPTCLETSSDRLCCPAGHARERSWHCCRPRTESFVGGYNHPVDFSARVGVDDRTSLSDAPTTTAMSRSLAASPTAFALVTCIAFTKHPHLRPASTHFLLFWPYH